MAYTFASDPNIVDILHLCATLLMLFFIIRDRHTEPNDNTRCDYAKKHP